MRVFTAAESKSAGEQRTSREALRAKGLADITTELLKERKQAEDDFEKGLRTQQNINEKEYQFHAERMNSLKREVEDLEERKKRALMPLRVREQDIQSKEVSLRALEAELDRARDELQEEARLLMLRLDDISSQKQALDERDRRSKRMEEGTLLQREQVAESAKMLNTQMSEFQMYVADKEIMFAHRQSELDARKNLYDEKDKGFTLREKRIQDDNTVIRQRYAELEKGFEILRKEQK